MTQNTYIPKVETEAVGVNTQTQDHKYMQTTPINLSTKYTNTPTSECRYMQTTPLDLSAKYVNTQTPDMKR